MKKILLRAACVLFVVAAAVVAFLAYAVCGGAHNPLC